MSAKRTTKKDATRSSSIKTEAKAKVDDSRAGSIQKGKRFRVQFDFDYIGSPGKKMKSESHTIPDMSLTIRQLLENHTRGVDSKVKVQREGYFEHHIPQLTDLTDVDEYMKALEAEAEHAREWLKNNPPEKFSNKDGEIIPEKPIIDSDGQTRIPDAT